MHLYGPLLPAAAGGITAEVNTTLGAVTTSSTATKSTAATVAVTLGAITTSATASVVTPPGGAGEDGADGFIFYWEL